MKEIKNWEKLKEKIETMKKSGGIDLSTEEDLSIAIMNLISLEEHFFFTGEKTGKEEYFDMLSEVREMRKSLLARMMTKNEGESWCISKHLLSASMRLMEVGTKLGQDGKKKEMKETFDYAYRLYSLFWALRLKLIDTQSLGMKDEKDKKWTVEDIVTKLVDCCNE
jgi:hypothetical protein